MSRSMRFKVGFFAALALVIVVGMIFSATHVFRSNDSLPENRLATVERDDLALSVVATGSVVPVATVEVKSKASGLVKSILVEAGDRVKEGEVLIELDKELLQAQLREAEASRMAASARLEETEAEARLALTQKVKLQLDLRNLEDNMAYIRKQVARYQNMFAEKLIPRSDIERAERELQDASLRVESLRSELLMQDARIEAARKAVARVKAEVIQAEANLDRTRENLRFATLTSPIAGDVLKRHVEVGDAVSSILQLGSQATLLLTLGDMNEVFVEGRVDESDIGKVFVSQDARVKVDAYRDRTFPGRVVRIAPLGEKVDNIIGFQVRVTIRDAERILRPQMSANAEIVIQEKKKVLVIPENVVIYDRERNTFVEVYETSAPNLRRRVLIKTGISNGTRTEVISGLQEGQKLVVPSTGLM